MHAHISLSTCGARSLSISSVARQHSHFSRSQPLRGRGTHSSRRAQLIEAYIADQRSGISPNKVGITDTLQDISQPSFNIVHIRRHAPADIDLLRAVQGQPNFKATVSQSLSERHDLLSLAFQALQLYGCA